MWVEFRAPSNLSSKGLELLSVLLYSKGAEPPLQPRGVRSEFCGPSWTELKTRVLKIRIQELVRKRDSLDKKLMAAKPLEESFKREGIEVSAHLIGL
jgi:hypothetical protein